MKKIRDFLVFSSLPRGRSGQDDFAKKYGWVKDNLIAGFCILAVYLVCKLGIWLLG